MAKPFLDGKRGQAHDQIAYTSAGGTLTTAANFRYDDTKIGIAEARLLLQRLKERMIEKLSETSH